MNPITAQAIQYAETEIEAIRKNIDLVNDLPDLPAKSIHANTNTVNIHVDSLASLQETVQILKDNGWTMSKRQSFGETIYYSFEHKDHPKFQIWEPLLVIISSDKVLDNLCV